MTRIKICGITNLEDAVCAVESGANAVGFVFAPGPRRVDGDSVRRICRRLPPFVSRVGVFTADFEGDINAIVRYCRLDTIQLHDCHHDIPAESFDVPVIRAYRVRSEETLDIIAERKPEYFLMDSYCPARAGGTGAVFDWNLARRARHYGRLILSGGLNPENIVSALETVHPYAVDVSSGVEKRPGIKDHGKICLFINEVKNWDNLTD